MLVKKLATKKLKDSLLKFIDWKENFGDLSYDRMDFWSSNSGKLAKKIFYRNKLLGAPLALWGLLLENFLPKIQKLYGKPSRQVIGDAHFTLSFLEMYKHTKEKKYLKEAERLINCMLKYSCNNYSGICWGYSFDWETTNGLFKKDTPLITITPYAFWAFKEHFLITKSKKSKENLLSIAKFALKDLKEKKLKNGTYSSSYSTADSSSIINASSYRAAVLIEAYNLNNNIEYLDSANRCIDFVLSFQGRRGEWFYEAKGPSDNMIDNFHTCFILRNLYICYRINKNQKILNAIKKGYDYYKDNLFYENGRPKHFSKPKYLKMRKYEMYDYAEGIKLGVLLNKDIPGSLEKSIFLANDLITNFQTKKGYFITRVTSLGTKHRVPYLRWPQAQLFYSLSLLLNLLNEDYIE